MKIRSIVALAALTAAAASLPAAAQSCVDLAIAPPDPLVEGLPESPGDGYIWSPGYWDCRGEGHEWRPGGWIPDQAGYNWQPHYWAHDGNNRWNLHPGRWHEGSHAGHEGGGHEGGQQGGGRR